MVKGLRRRGASVKSAEYLLADSGMIFYRAQSILRPAVETVAVSFFLRLNHAFFLQDLCISFFRSVIIMINRHGDEGLATPGNPEPLKSNSNYNEKFITLAIVGMYTT